jgi:predicted dehydrogenase
MIHTDPQTRRDFLKFSATVAAMLGFAGCSTLMTSPRKAVKIKPGAKVRFAQVGCGGKGFSDTMAHKADPNKPELDLAEVVAICDIDHDRPNVKKLFEEFPNAKRYKDFRKMLIEMDGEIDAVGVATPDHMHFLPAYMALMMGKHVYVQKPLTQTVGEARELLRIARLTGACTQMGNQGHSGEGIRLVREWFEAGLLGDVREVNIWTNRPGAMEKNRDGTMAFRPVWPQGIAQWPKEDPVPPGFDQNLFLGRAQWRPFSKEIHPFKWRGYRDYGCGALGDMACHLMDASYWGLQLGAPKTVELVKINGLTDIQYPKSAIVRFQFPARGNLPPVTLTWHEGGEKPAKPKEMEAERELAHGGQLWQGSKAVVYDGHDYCDSPRFVPETLHKELVEGGKLPPKKYPRPNPVGNPHKEWMKAIHAYTPSMAGSNFEYSVPFTEMVCLGTVSILVGKKFEWDSAAMKTSLAEANNYMYPTYRAGWEKENVLAGKTGPVVA